MEGLWAVVCVKHGCAEDLSHFSGDNMSSSDEEGSDSSQDYGEEREELEAKEGEAAIDSVPTTNMASMQHDGEDTDLKEAARSRAQVKTKKRLLSAMEKAKKKGKSHFRSFVGKLFPLKYCQSWRDTRSYTLYHT